MNQLEKEIVIDLYNQLAKRDTKSSELLDILDVLLKVNQKLDTEKHPERLINRLTQLLQEKLAFLLKKKN